MNTETEFLCGLKREDFQTTVNGNNALTTSFWISLASLAASILSTISVVTR